jgi:hypothetical protein
MFGMKVVESSHPQFLNMEEKNYMKQNKWVVIKPYKAWNLKLLLDT